MLLSIGFPDEKQLIGAYHKSRRDERPQTGAQAPGGNATTKEAPTGRQSLRQSLNVLYANQLDVLSPLRGFFSRHVPYRGFTPPSVVFRTSGAYLADNNNIFSRLAKEFEAEKSSASNLNLYFLHITFTPCPLAGGFFHSKATFAPNAPLISDL